MIARIGMVEMCNLNAYHAKKLKLLTKIPSSYLYILHNNAGFFPINSNLVDDWGKLYTDCSKNIDLFAVFSAHSEDYLVKEFMPNAQLTYLKALEPYYHQNPWSRALKGKKVLVIHPFSESIEKQFKIKEKLFENKDILPDFELITVKAINTVAGNTAGFSDWFEALDYMKNQVSKLDFEIAIIGCGAYGLPIASYIKNMGKKAIVTAGATQILFGIKGKRWDNHPEISKLYNEFWIRPSETEAVKGNEKVEGGCYW